MYLSSLNFDEQSLRIYLESQKARSYEEVKKCMEDMLGQPSSFMKWDPKNFYCKQFLAPIELPKKRPIIGIVDVIAFAFQISAQIQKDTDWLDGPAVGYLATKSKRIVSANKFAKDYGITNSISFKQAGNIIRNASDTLMLKAYEVPTYPNGKPNQTSLRDAAFSIRMKVIEHICSHIFPVKPIVEWVPLDEFYIDLTEFIHILLREGWRAVLTFLDEISIEKNITNPCFIHKFEFNKDPSTWPLVRAIHENPEDEKSLTTVTPHADLDILIGAKIVNFLMSEIHHATGLQTTGGVSVNKMLAKIAGFLAHPGSVMFLRKSDIRTHPTILSKIPLKKLSSIPPEDRAILKEMGLETAADIATLEQKELEREGFTILQMRQIYGAAKRGFDDSKVVEKHFTKNINCARSYTSMSKIYDESMKFQLLFVYWARDECNVSISNKNCGREDINVFVEQINWYIGVSRLKVSGTEMVPVPAV